MSVRLDNTKRMETTWNTSQKSIWHQPNYTTQLSEDSPFPTFPTHSPPPPLRVIRAAQVSNLHGSNRVDECTSRRQGHSLARDLSYLFKGESHPSRMWYCLGLHVQFRNLKTGRKRDEIQEMTWDMEIDMTTDLRQFCTGSENGKSSKTINLNVFHSIRKKKTIHMGHGHLPFAEYMLKSWVRSSFSREHSTYVEW